MRNILHTQQKALFFTRVKMWTFRIIRNAAYLEALSTWAWMKRLLLWLCCYGYVGWVVSTSEKLCTALMNASSATICVSPLRKAWKRSLVCWSCCLVICGSKNKQRLCHEKKMFKPNNKASFSLFTSVRFTQITEQASSMLLAIFTKYLLLFKFISFNCISFCDSFLQS